MQSKTLLKISVTDDHPSTNSNSVNEEIFDEIEEEHTSVPKRVICMAIDLSVHAEYSLNYCLDNIFKSNDEIILLNVRSIQSDPSWEVGFVDNMSDFIKAGEKEVTLKI